jgi:ribosomal protein L11 methyltransferase
MWVLQFWCGRSVAETLPDPADAFPDWDDPPTINAEEPDPARPDDWLVSVYFTAQPDAAARARLAALIPAAATGELAALADQDWTVLSQQGLEPVRAGRFVVHTADHADAVCMGDWGLRIDAGLAFGTGQHATTHGCLHAIAQASKARRFANIADIGTGTGVLAMAAARGHRAAAVIASDNDPVAVAVAAANLRLNRFIPGSCNERIALAVAAGVAAPALRARAPYDLVLANILAGPLVAMARDLAGVIAPGGLLVLAGLLQHQQRGVANAYRRHGLVPAWAVDRRAEWPCLVLQRKLL